MHVTGARRLPVPEAYRPSPQPERAGTLCQPVVSAGCRPRLRCSALRTAPREARSASAPTSRPTACSATMRPRRLRSSTRPRLRFRPTTLSCAAAAAADAPNTLDHEAALPHRTFSSTEPCSQRPRSRQTPRPWTWTATRCQRRALRRPRPPSGALETALAQTTRPVRRRAPPARGIPPRRRGPGTNAASTPPPGRAASQAPSLPLSSRLPPRGTAMPPLPSPSWTGRRLRRGSGQEQHPSPSVSAGRRRGRRQRAAQR